MNLSQPRWLTVLVWLIFLSPLIGLLYAQIHGTGWDPWSAWL